MHGTIALSRKGRKRKMRARHPGGRLKAEPRLSPKQVADSQPHRREVPRDFRLDQRAESTLGRLAITGYISPSQYRAGRRWASIVARYRVVIDCPSEPKSIAGIMEPRRGGGYLPADVAKERLMAYDNAFCMLAAAGRRAQMLVNDVAVHNKYCPVDRLDDLRKGLTALAEWFAAMDKTRAAST